MAAVQLTHPSKFDRHDGISPDGHQYQSKQLLLDPSGDLISANQSPVLNYQIIKWQLKERHKSFRTIVTNLCRFRWPNCWQIVLYDLVDCC